MTIDDVDFAATNEPQNLQLEQLVAARIALNPARRAWRNDIVLSTTVALLTSGDRTTAELLELVNRTLRSRTLTIPELAASLELARRAGLVQPVRDLIDVERWQATPTARDEVEEDRSWARAIYAQFESDLESALRERNTPVAQEKVPKYAANLLRALSAGSCESMHVEQVTERSLRPLTFDRNAVHAQLRTVDPRSAREALADLADAAMDRDDPFGDEIIHLLVVSNLLHAMFTRSDVPTNVDLAGMRVLLDTSTLLDLIAEDTPEQKLLIEGLRLWNDADIEIVVGHHTVDEWARVWDAAVRQDPSQYDDADLEPLTHRLLKSNPFIAEFVRRKTTLDPALTWRRFENGVRDLESLLRHQPVKVRPDGNHEQSDIEIVERALEIIKELADDPDVPGHRTKGGATADAASCAMLVRWRRKQSGPHLPFFVANERLTELAYQQLVPDDDVPVTINVAGLTAYVAAVTTADPSRRAHIADVVSTAVVRDTIFGVATQYTLDEAIELAKMLAEDDGVRPEDARAALQLNLETLLDEAERADEPARVLAAGGELLRRRSARRDERARRQRSQADKRERAIAERERAADARVAAAETARDAHAAENHRLRHDLAATTAQQDPPSARPQSSEGWTPSRWRKAMTALTVSLLTAAAVAVAFAAGHLDTGRKQVLAAGGALIVAGTCADVAAHDRRWIAAVIATAIAAGYLIVEVAIGWPSGGR